MHASPTVRRLLVLPAAALLCLSLLTACGSAADTASAPSTATPAAPAVTPGPEPAKVVVAPAALNADGLLKGDATPAEYPAGDPGKVSVVFTGAFSPQNGSTMPIVIRNNTDAAISHVDVNATARSAGALLATGTSQGTTPAQIAPGGLALGYVYFKMDAAAPADATYKFTFETSPADKSSYNASSLQTTEVVHTGDNIVGTGVNSNDVPVVGPVSADVYCFDSAGNPSATVRAYANESDEIAAGGVVSFTASLYDMPCATFLVGLTGYFA